jgi:superfamily II DNA or RNA helicase
MLPSKSATPALPSGWWDAIPEKIRSQFDRRVLRRGYVLHQEGKACITGFFRNAFRVAVEENGLHLVHFRRPEEKNIASWRSHTECTCHSAKESEPCAHVAAALFLALPFKGYETSAWAHLATSLCRTHSGAGSLDLNYESDRVSLYLANGALVLSLHAEATFQGFWNVEHLLPDGWESSTAGGAFGTLARLELTEQDKTTLRTLGHAPSQRAEFGPIGELCRRAYAMVPKVKSRLDWDAERGLFLIRLGSDTVGLQAEAYLGCEQAFSFRNRLPETSLGEGFLPSGEAWTKAMEIRVTPDGGLQLRPYVTLPDGARIFPAATGDPLYFGNMPLFPGIGFRALAEPASPLFKRYSGWKTYSVAGSDVLAFLSKYGAEFGGVSDGAKGLVQPESPKESTVFDLDALLRGGFHPAPIDLLDVCVEAREAKRLRVALTYRCGDYALDMAGLHKMQDSNQSCLLTAKGWIDLTGPDWSWVKRLKREAWHHASPEKMTLWVEPALLLRIAALQAPGRITLSGIAAPELQSLPGLASQAQPEDAVSDNSALESVATQGLRPYQVEGLQWLTHLVAHGVSGILADDMGLGKTHQVMALAAWLARRVGPKVRMLVVCPTSVLYHWKEKFDAYYPELQAALYYGVDRKPTTLEHPMVITSFGVARNDMETLRKGAYDLLVIDEIQNAKNRDSETHRCFLEFPAQSVIGLSGTPLENGPADVKNLFDLLLPGYFPGDGQFRDEVLDPLEKKQGAEQAIVRFQRLCRPFILRRTKSQVLTDLPEKVEEVLHGDMTPDQASLYQQCLHKRGGPMLEDLVQARPSSYFHVFQLLNHLKQICNHPMSLPGAERGDKEYGSGKWDLFEFILNQALEAGSKVVVFSQYLAMLGLIEEHLAKKGVGFATLTGSTRDRQAVLSRFRDDSTCRVFCCSLKAGGVGIDLTTASTVIHYDRWWNAARENQATDRVHRIGQQRNVQVFKLVTRGTLEERIDAIIRRKAEFMESMLPDDGEGTMNLLSREELIELLRP